MYVAVQLRHYSRNRRLWRDFTVGLVYTVKSPLFQNVQNVFFLLLQAVFTIWLKKQQKSGGFGGGILISIPIDGPLCEQIKFNLSSQKNPI